MHVCMHVCVHVHMHACMRVCVCVCVCACMHVCMYALCVHVCIMCMCMYGVSVSQHYVRSQCLHVVTLGSFPFRIASWSWLHMLGSIYLWVQGVICIIVVQLTDWLQIYSMSINYGDIRSQGVPIFKLVHVCVCVCLCVCVCACASQSLYQMMSIEFISHDFVLISHSIESPSVHI